MAQQDVLDYIRKTPHNSNVNVVKGMLGDSSSSALPEVTELDNGKVLTVVEGQWDKAEASEGGGGSDNVLTVPIIVDYSTMQATTNKTYQEIASAIEAGQLVIGDVIFSNLPTTHSLCFISYDLENSDTDARKIGFIVFAPVLATVNEITGLYAVVVSIMPDDTITLSMATKQF